MIQYASVHVAQNMIHSFLYSYRQHRMLWLEWDLQSRLFDVFILVWKKAIYQLVLKLRFERKTDMYMHSNLWEHLIFSPRDLTVFFAITQAFKLLYTSESQCSRSFQRQAYVFIHHKYCLWFASNCIPRLLSGQHCSGAFGHPYRQQFSRTIPADCEEPPSPVSSGDNIFPTYNDTWKSGKF